MPKKFIYRIRIAYGPPDISWNSSKRQNQDPLNFQSTIFHIKRALKEETGCKKLSKYVEARLAASSKQTSKFYIPGLQLFSIAACIGCHHFHYHSALEVWALPLLFFCQVQSIKITQWFDVMLTWLRKNVVCWPNFRKTQSFRVKLSCWC